jgi:hypothetical protein
MKKAAVVLMVICLGLTTAAWGADPLEKLKSLRAELEYAWNETPLTATNIAFVTQQPEGYGMYVPRADDIFNAIDPILIYCEPVGYTVVKNGDQYEFNLSADFTVADDKGNILGGQENFGSWGVKSRAFNTEFMMFFTFNLKGLPGGKYKLQVTLKDANSDKKTSFQQAFAIK